jgi:hypothetical protein
MLKEDFEKLERKTKIFKKQNPAKQLQTNQQYKNNSSNKVQEAGEQPYLYQ